MFNRILDAQVGLQLRMLDRVADSDGGSDSRGRRGRIAGTGVAGATLFAPAFAAAAPAGQGQGACQDPNASTSGLTALIKQAANFLIIVGGAFAVLMFAIGGFMIMAGGASRQKKKGMDVVKNALVGLVILVAGVFIREVIVKFVTGATNTDQGTCIKDGFGSPVGGK